MGPLGMKDEAFWEDPHGEDEAVQTRLIDDGFQGLLVDAPARLPIARRQTLPLVGVHAVSLRETHTLDLRRAAIAVAVKLETNEVWADLAFEPRDRPPEGAGLIAPDPPLEDVPEGCTLVSFDADLRARLRLPWEPGTLLVGLIVRERTSNRVTTKLESAPPAFRDPAVAAFKATHERALYPQPIWPQAVPGRPLPSYRARKDSPPVPEAVGIALAVERLIPERPGADVLLRGSFRLPVLERERVKPREGAPVSDDPRARRAGEVWQDPGDPDATAVIPITIVATGARRPAPLVLRLQVPSHDPIDPAAKAPVVTGHFAVELRGQGGGDELAAQTSFIYALSGQVLAGPAVVALVDPQEVP